MKPLKSKVIITLGEDVIQLIKGLARKDVKSFIRVINMVQKEYISKMNKTTEK